MWRHLLKNITINSHAIDALVGIADEFIQTHAPKIPIGVQTSWADLRGALLTWKTDLAAQERKK